MATKTIDVTLVSIENVGTVPVAPKGNIRCVIIRAQDDEQEFHSEILYSRESGQPVHPGGARQISPGESLIYNVTRRLEVSHFDEAETEGLNQSLMFSANMREDLVVSGNIHTEVYGGQLHRKVRFDDIEKTPVVSLDYKAFDSEVEGKIIVTYTVDLIFSSEDDRVREESLVDAPRYSSD
jgi:hypothetical protein